ncbi:MAG: MATE family efflux transporter [Kiritimatiellia bacterium]
MVRDSRLKELGEAPLGRLLFRYSWPALVSMTLNALYSVVDRFYIGNGCGMDAMAGMSFAIPVMMVFAAFGVWIGAGHSALLSIKLGEGDRIAAEKTLGQLVAFKILFFLVLPVLVLPFLDPLLRLMGASGVSAEALRQGRLYLSIVLPPQVFLHLAFGLSGMMRAEGAVHSSMMCMVVGFVLNMVLDPLLIFGLDMGIAGAAWATNASMFCSCLWAIRHYARRTSVVGLRLSAIRFHRRLAVRAMGIGMGPFLQQVLGALISLSLPKALTLWSASPEEATVQVAALGIFHAVMILFFMPVMGLQQGISPIMGFNWGARNYGRVRELFVLGFWMTTAMVAFASFSQLLFPAAIARAFGAEGACLAASVKVLRVSNCMLWCIGINVMATTYFQSIGKPLTAILLSTLRQGVCLLPCLWLLPHVLGGDPVLAIWLALPISDVLCQLATIPPLHLHLTFLKRAAERLKKDGR